MPSTRAIERKWIENFKKSALVDQETNTFIGQYANQLFYGKLDDKYPPNFPENFDRLLNLCGQMDKIEAMDKILIYLHFIGIKISKDRISTHLKKFPDDFTKITKKCRYILKSFAHFDETLNLNNPFKDNSGDLFFLSRIESDESITGGQLNLFEDIELPDLYKKIFNIPEGYENDEIAMELFRQVENSNDTFFITGKAGTGKSTFIQYFSKNTSKKVLMTAFTGIAAINVGGQTLHSFFRFPFKPLMPEDHEITKFEEYSQKYKIIEKIDTIVIDEISMLRSDILEAIDFSLRMNGGNPHQKFGGKQILFVGDVFQLPPIKAEEVEGMNFHEIYKSKYFFDAPAYKMIAPKYFEFAISYRQKDDLPFVQLLDTVRICKVNDECLDKLNERYDPEFTPKIEDFVITLSSINSIADTENAKKLRELPYPSLPPFEAEVTGEFDESRYPTSKTLELKRNAQVIFIKNDLDKRWVNGTIAKIDFITKDRIEIRLKDSSIHVVAQETWENRRYKYDKEKKRIVSEVVGTFKQYPIKLAWAITIHKSQGLTFDNVVIDLGSGAFVNGQLYTALSRCRTFNGITLKRKIKHEDIITDKRIIDFHETEQLINTICETDEEV